MSLSKAIVLFLACSVIVAAGRRESGAQSKQQLSASRPAPQTIRPQSPSDLMVPMPMTEVMRGEATGATERDAFDRAKRNAVEQWVAVIAGVLFDRPEYLGLYEAASLRDYVTTVGTVVEKYSRTARESGRYHAWVTFEMKAGYLQLSTIREFASQSLYDHPRGALLVPPTRLNDAWKPVRIEVRAKDPSKGSFAFNVSLRRELNGPISLRVDGLRVIQDGSGGSTSWGFEVWMNGRIVITVPEARYDERVGLYRLPPEDKGLAATERADGAGYVEFHFIGTKPSAKRGTSFKR
jgi:hypothetical protein